MATSKFKACCRAALGHHDLKALMLSLKNLHHKISDVFIKENVVICSENVNEIQFLGFLFFL
jgi:hypothetical protein